jgi:TctA family transporter
VTPVLATRPSPEPWRTDRLRKRDRRIATPGSLFNVVWATLLGIAVGMMPGLTATLGVALLTTLTFRMAAGDAILILVCTYVGAIYGGSRTAILLNIPGTPANAASSLDGFPWRARAAPARRWASPPSARSSAAWSACCSSS